ncbi:MAG: methionine-R-sulfoxide reductase [Myxococcota bacterium]|jgi:methionine-R-sulfoxide reductase
MDWNEVLRRADGDSPAPPRRVEKTEAEWQAVLTPAAFEVTRRAATERPMSSDLCGLFVPGRYACVCCSTLLFDAAQKFESGSGWPSFTDPLDGTAVAYIADRSHGMTRVETTCAVCDAHLGHVFPDGPAPSGLRYCMNGVALAKVSD